MELEFNGKKISQAEKLLLLLITEIPRGFLEQIQVYPLSGTWFMTWARLIHTHTHTKGTQTDKGMLLMDFTHTSVTIRTVN